MKRSKNVWVICLIISLLLSCNSNPKNPSSSLSEKFIEDTILSLKEVQEKNTLIDSMTNKEHGISIIIDKPTDQEPNYNIQVGYNNPERFETYYHFSINPSTKQIFIQDFAVGHKVPLDQWRNQNIDSVYLDLGMALLKSENLNGLQIGLPEDKIITLLGEPDETSKATKWGADGMLHQTWIYKNKGIELDVCWEKPIKKEIYRITISAPCSFKTSREIGIGSGRELVREAYITEINPKEENKDFIIAGSEFGGINFEFKNNKVESISIGANAE